MTVGLHCRLARPARAAAIAEFVDYAKSFGREVWICTREEIANHWYENHLPRGVGTPILASGFSSSGGGGGGGGVGAGRFSFLGNLTTPRDQHGQTSLSGANNAASQGDGDII
jgi:hypothetical protein